MDKPSTGGPNKGLERSWIEKRKNSGKFEVANC